MFVRHALGLVRDLGLAAARSGRWWLVVVVPLLWVAAAAVFFGKTVVPVAVYAFL